MDVTWLVDEYLGNGKARHAAFSSKRRAIEVAGKSCDHSSRVLWYTNLTLSEREKGTHDER